MTNLCYEHVGEQMQWLYTRVKSDSAISAKMLETAAPEFTLQNTSSTVWEKGGRIDACRMRSVTIRTRFIFFYLLDSLRLRAETP